MVSIFKEILSLISITVESSFVSVLQADNKQKAQNNMLSFFKKKGVFINCILLKLFNANLNIQLLKLKGLTSTNTHFLLYY
tara:strand:- start:1795 stop:2037 length:243 start_codon:yes stop_codon:yes gene_type:complete